MSNQWPVSIFRRTKKQQHGRFEDAGASVEQWSEPCFQVEWYSMSAYLFVEVLWYRRHQWSRAMLIHHTIAETKCYKQKQQFISQYPNNTFDWIVNISNYIYCYFMRTNYKPTAHWIYPVLLNDHGRTRRLARRDASRLKTIHWITNLFVCLNGLKVLGAGELRMSILMTSSWAPDHWQTSIGLEPRPSVLCELTL